MFDKFPEYVRDLVDAGIEVTLKKNDTLGYYLDLNLRAKSHMYLFDKDGKWYVAMRYDEVYEVEDLYDLKYQARRGMHGRDFIDYNWAKFLGM